MPQTTRITEQRIARATQAMKPYSPSQFPDRNKPYVHSFDGGRVCIAFSKAEDGWFIEVTEFAIGESIVNPYPLKD